jgi:4-hydroxy-4-methyl-2-oxoglutarate aldolase
MSSPVAASDLDALRRFDTCRLANAIEECDVRLRNEGYARPGLRCLFPDLPGMIGYAVTVQIRCSNPPPTGHVYPDRTDWWAALASMPAPRLVVIEDIDPHPGMGAFVGEVHAAILQALGCAGAVTNGAVRDLPGVRALGFPLFAASVSVSHAYAHIVNFNEPVRICGLPIRPGDLLRGDCHGLISIPPGIAGELPSVMARQEARDQEILALCRSADFSISRLREEVGGIRQA